MVLFIRPNVLTSVGRSDQGHVTLCRTEAGTLVPVCVCCVRVCRGSDVVIRVLLS